MTYPDIEIYIKNGSLEDIANWLSGLYLTDKPKQSGRTLSMKLVAQEKEMNCKILENAVEDNYTSIHFFPNYTKWSTDLECAKEAFDRLGLEVRCSIGGWNEDSSIENFWHLIDSEGNRKIEW